MDALRQLVAFVLVTVTRVFSFGARKKQILGDPPYPGESVVGDGTQLFCFARFGGHPRWWKSTAEHFSWHTRKFKHRTKQYARFWAARLAYWFVSAAALNNPEADWVYRQWRWVQEWEVERALFESELTRWFPIPLHAASSPTLIQHCCTNSIGGNQPASKITLPLNHPTGANNLLVTGFNTGDDTVAVTMGDSTGGSNVWNVVDTCNTRPSGAYTQMHAAYGVVSGTSYVTFDYGTTNKVHYWAGWVSEYAAVATSAALATHNQTGTTSATTAWTSAATTGTTGDLAIYYCAGNNAQYYFFAAAAVTANWTFLTADLQGAMIVAHRVLASTGSLGTITFTITADGSGGTSPSTGYNSIIATFSASAGAGTVPTYSTPYVRRRFDYQIAQPTDGGSTTLTIQATSEVDTKLMTLAYNGHTTSTVNKPSVNSVTSSLGNTWASRFPGTPNGKSRTMTDLGWSTIDWIDSFITTAGNEVLTVTLANATGVEAMWAEVKEVLNANAYDTNAFNNTGNQGSGSGHQTYVSITTNNANELVMCAGDQDFGTCTGFSGVSGTPQFTAPTYPELDGSGADDLLQDSLTGHVLAASATTYNLTVINTVDSTTGIADWYALAVAYTAPAVVTSIPAPVLISTYGGLPKACPRLLRN